MNLEEAMACAKIKMATLVVALNELSIETYFEDYDGTLEIVLKSKATNREMHSVKVLYPKSNEQIDDNTQYAVVHTVISFNVVTFTADGKIWFKHYSK